MHTQPGRVRPRNLLLIGPSNNGKSTIAEKFLREHPPTSSKAGYHRVAPVVADQMPPDATIGRFYAALLQALGSPVLPRNDGERRSAFTLDLMRTCEVRLLVIDELHNLLCGPTSRQRELLGLLRYLGNELRIPIAALGTKDAYLALRLDDQLENRFEPFVLARWNDDEETGRLLASFEALLPLRELSSLGSPIVRRAIVEKTDGLIGEISQLLTTATVRALMSSREAISVEDIASCSFEAPSVRRQTMERVLRA